MIDMIDAVVLGLLAIIVTFILTSLGVTADFNKEHEVFAVANEACQFRRIEIAVVDEDGNIYCVDREDLVMFRPSAEG